MIWMDEAQRQEALDQFYWQHGPCCAGCDHWQSISFLIGNCTNSKIVSGAERASMIGIERSSMNFGAGHAVTGRSYKCGAFKDEFDWSTLPLPYRKRVGGPV